MRRGEGEEVGPGCLRAVLRAQGEGGSGTSAEPPRDLRTYKAKGNENTATASAFSKLPPPLFALSTWCLSGVWEIKMAPKFDTAVISTNIPLPNFYHPS